MIHTRMAALPLMAWAGLAISAFAQEPVGTAFTYQGRLTDGGSAADGIYDMRFLLFSDDAGTVETGDLCLDDVTVSDGLFSVELDFGLAAFGPDARWMEVAVREDAGVDCTLDSVPSSYTALAPLRKVNPSPLSRVATNGPYGAIGGGTGNDVTDRFGAIGGGENNQAGDNDPDPENVTHAFVGGGLSNQASGVRSVVGGGNTNKASGENSAVGGGTMNHAMGQAATVGGGVGNEAQGFQSTIAGGHDNTASGVNSTVAGGTSSVANALAATVGGGSGNTATGDYSTAAGGRGNNGAGSDSTVSGGRQNSAAGSESTVGGGFDNSAFDNQSTVGGGSGNSAGKSDPDSSSTTGATVAGGRLNAASDSYATVGGGDSNVASDAAATVAGGSNNAAQSAYAFIGGGENNTALAAYSVVGGGQTNEIDVPHGVIAGGKSNVVEFFAGTIGGGDTNFIGVEDGKRDKGAIIVPPTNPSATIAGGSANSVTASGGTVGGGNANYVGDEFSVIAGGTGNQILPPITLKGFGPGPFPSAISGGVDNTSFDRGASIGGGTGNVVHDQWGTIGGGFGNQTGAMIVKEDGKGLGPVGLSTVGGGFQNTAEGAYSTIGGGFQNAATGNLATIPGGGGLTAAGDRSFAAGSNAEANHEGAIVFGDATFDATVQSGGDNHFVVRASGGYTFYTASDLSSAACLLPGAGSWSCVSDEDAKENFEALDPAEVLEKVASMNIRGWNYKTQADDVRHIGPTAQEFHAAFGTGASDRMIDTVDADGVALAAIQGLNGKLEEKNREIAELNERLARLEALLLEKGGRE